tara:strand:+ start:323 stop:505 length:183 start_codon:yes stop_codon:yes gene_type:complete
MKKTYQVVITTDGKDVQVESASEMVPVKSKVLGRVTRLKTVDKRAFTRNFMNLVDTFKCK